MITDLQRTEAELQRISDTVRIINEAVDEKTSNTRWWVDQIRISAVPGAISKGEEPPSEIFRPGSGWIKRPSLSPLDQQHENADEITEKRATVQAENAAAAIEYGHSQASYPEMSLDWLAYLPAAQDETYYEHPIAGSSPIDLFECGIIKHGRVPASIELSHMSHLAAALYGHNQYYRRPTGDILLLVKEDIPDNAILLRGSQVEENKKSLLSDQPTVELGALPPLSIMVMEAA